MTRSIEKNGIYYRITENAEKWFLSAQIGRLKLENTIDKIVCESFEELKDYIMSNDSF